MLKICNHCRKSTTFMVTLVAQGKATLVNDAYELLEQGDLGIQEGSLVCAECGQPVKEAELVDGMACAKCGTVHPLEDLLQLQNEDGSNGDVICQGCYAAMCNPQPEPQAEPQPQVQEQAPVDPKDAIIAQQNQQMAEMMANMQAMQAQMQAMMGGQAPAQAAVTTSQPPVQQPTVATNIPAPNAPVQQPVAQPTVNQNPVVQPTAQNTVNVGTTTTEVPGDMFGGEAPF